MAIVDDRMAVTILTELDGVAMQNTRYFEIDALGTEPTNAASLLEIVTGYHDSIKAYCFTGWKIVCATLENLTTPEGKTVIFVTLAGMSIVDSHPQHQVLRFNIAAQQQPENIMHYGAFNQSGIIESKSNRGRVAVPDDFNPLVQWLGLDMGLGGTGWSVSPLLRFNATPPSPPNPFTEDFDVIQKVQVNTEFKTLRSRKTVLCAVA